MEIKYTEYFQKYVDINIKYIRFSGLIYDLIDWVKKYPEVTEIEQIRKCLNYYFDDIRAHFTKEEIKEYFESLDKDELIDIIDEEEDEFWVDYDLEDSLFGDSEVSDQTDHWFLVPDETICINFEKFFRIYLGIIEEPEGVNDGK